MFAAEGMTLWLLAGGSVVAILYLLLRGEPNPATERLAQLEGGGTVPPTDGTFGEASIGRNASGARSTAVGAAQEDLEKKERRTLKSRLLQAGLYRPYAMGLFMAMRIALCVAPVVVGMVFAGSGAITRNQALFGGFLVGMIGTLAPSFWLDFLKRRRQTQVRRALPDALDVIVVCLEGGLSLSSALTRVAGELSKAHPLLALELHIVQREVQLGRTTGEALREFSRRFDLDELRSLATVVTHAERFGTSVTKALTVYADTMRLKRHQRAEELAQKAVVKVLFPTVLCIFPGIFIVLLGPAAIKIYNAIVLGSKNGTL